MSGRMTHAHGGDVAFMARSGREVWVGVRTIPSRFRVTFCCFVVGCEALSDSFGSSVVPVIFSACNHAALAAARHLAPAAECAQRAGGTAGAAHQCTVIVA